MEPPVRNTESGNPGLASPPTGVEGAGSARVASPAVGGEQVAAGADAALRRTASPWTLIRMAIGGPREVGGKLARLARTLWLYLKPGEVPARLETLRQAGLVEEVPGRGQVFFGGLDMLRFVIEPFARSTTNSRASPSPFISSSGCSTTRYR